MLKSSKTLRWAGAALALTLVAAACGNDDGSSAPITVERGAAAADDMSEGMGARDGVVVSLGDSYISGTAGRWKGNSNGFTNVPRNSAAFQRSDTGADAYDNYGVVHPGDDCFRSRSALIHIGGLWESENLSCSAARTFTRKPDENGNFKPGIAPDGQLGYLADVAASKPVKMVVLSIGGNDFGFGSIVKACVTGFLTSSLLSPDLCSENPEVLAKLAPAEAAKVQAAVAQALGAVVTTMREAGYADEDWTLISQNYPNPLAPRSAMRYGQFGYDRQAKGGCAFYDDDLDWFPTVLATVNATVAKAVLDAEAATGKNIETIDLTRIFEGRRLCESGTKLVEETANEAEQLRFAERIEMIRLSTTIYDTPYDVNEAVHPNFYGQLALRSCLRQAFNDGDARSGACLPPADWGVVDANGEPTVTFVPA